MLKQGVVQEAIADINMPTAPLPPLNNLPQWSRINTLDKARYPKPFLKDRLQPLPNPSENNSPTGQGEDVDDRELGVEDSVNPKLRVNHLERSLNFLRQQHQDILANLHEEIEKLKRDNKELQFRLVVMHSKTGSPASASSKKKSISAQHKSRTTQSRENSAQSHTSEAPPGGLPPDSDLLREQIMFQDPPSQDEKIDELKVIFLEEEIRELKTSLREEKNRNHYLTQLLEEVQASQLLTTDTKPPTLIPHPPGRGSEKGHRKAVSASVTSALSSSHHSAPPDHNAPQVSDGDNPTDDASSSHQGGSSVKETVAPPEVPLPFNATLEPLLVHQGGGGSQAPRPPTMQECQVLLQHMQRVNDRQSHELNQLKSDLRDVLYSHKWTPDAYLLAKAYIAEDDAREAALQDRLPKIALKQPSRKLPDIAYIQKDALSLPALKQTMGNKAIERRKRTQILHKSRLRREVLP